MESGPRPELEPEPGPAADLGRAREQLWGWLGPLVVALLAGAVRFWNLGRPEEQVFDEVHYVKDATRLLNYGVEYDPSKGEPAFVVHPPVGKWLIAAGEWALGENPVGWRLVPAILGTLTVLMLARIVRRMFASTLLGCVAGMLLALDGLHFVHSRAALLDLPLTFFALAAFGALVVDRDHARNRLLSTLKPGRFGPGLGLRPWRILAGVCLGLACGTKWSGLYFVAAFGLLTVGWDVFSRHAAGVRSPVLGALQRDALPAFASIVGVGSLTYLASWVGWFRSDAEHAWKRSWAKDNPEGGWDWVPDSLVSLGEYHREMLHFHSNLDTAHPYQSQAWDWLLLLRPVSFYYEGPKEGVSGCEVPVCSEAIIGLGNPAIWWGGSVALLVCVALWLVKRDWRAGAAVVGVAAGYLPWFLLTERTIFSFYAVAFLPFLVIAITCCLALVLGPPDAPGRRRRVGQVMVGTYLLLVLGLFWYFHPVLSAELIPQPEWKERMWFDRWI